ncbi:hypothetical protein Syun_019079 [Stephania yunnanensis]|uniref:Uncharacterized protein n=1 Tax=Stephania yunnanensis TaxID=152371 RepID=A0AAP0NVK9_9MAGN
MSWPRGTEYTDIAFSKGVISVHCHMDMTHRGTQIAPFEKALSVYWTFFLTQTKPRESLRPATGRDEDQKLSTSSVEGGDGGDGAERRGGATTAEQGVGRAATGCHADKTQLRQGCAELRQGCTELRQGSAELR